MMIRSALIISLSALRSSPARGIRLPALSLFPQIPKPLANTALIPGLNIE